MIWAGENKIFLCANLNSFGQNKHHDSMARSLRECKMDGHWGFAKSSAAELHNPFHMNDHKNVELVTCKILQLLTKSIDLYLSLWCCLVMIHGVRFWHAYAVWCLE